MEKLLVKNTPNTVMGVLSFDKEANLFTFEYDKDFEGLKYSDINVKNGRSFTQDSMFNLFSFDDSWGKSELIRIHQIEDKTENEIQWYFKTLLANEKGVSRAGYLFENF